MYEAGRIGVRVGKNEAKHLSQASKGWQKVTTVIYTDNQMLFIYKQKTHFIVNRFIYFFYCLRDVTHNALCPERFG